MDYTEYRETNHRLDYPAPVALTIAGSDSGGGAGIQADLKTFHQFGVFGTSAITAITAQNTIGVTAIHPIPLSSVSAQIDAVASDLRPAAIKTGMLATAEVAEIVASKISAHKLNPYVMDPVMVATNGRRLLEHNATITLLNCLVPLATLVTPNLQEAEILTGDDVRTVSEMKRAARWLVDAGADAALVKGGHLDGDAIDVLWDGTEELLWRHPRIDTLHTHGTGCTLSAAVTASLAAGLDMATAVNRAILFVQNSISSAPRLGKGRGPINLLASPQ